MDAYPVYFEHAMEHYSQRFDWDCGLSSILMVLPTADRQAFLQHFKQICSEEGFGQSTWTIDLCYVLQRFHLAHKYLTTTIGINPNYNNHSYYDRILTLDEERINRKFLDAQLNGIAIEKRSVNSKYLVHHLATYGPVILLTNASLLTCDICRANKLSMEFRQCFAFKPAYTGHYIVLCGFNLRVQKFLYRNPAKKNRVCVMSFHKLDAARLNHGTDEDIILIYSKTIENKKTLNQ